MLQILKKSGINNIDRIEYSNVYDINQEIDYDKMLFEVYNEDSISDNINIPKDTAYYVDDIRQFNRINSLMNKIYCFTKKCFHENPQM